MNDVIWDFPKRVRASSSVNGRNFVSSLVESVIEDCKRFIQDFVDSVIVFEDKVEVNLKIPEPSSSLIIRRTVNRQFLPTVRNKPRPP